MIAAEDGINFSGFGVGGEIDRELIEILLLPSSRNARGALRQSFDTDGNGLCGFLISVRTGDDVSEILVQGFGADFLQFACDFTHEARKIARTGNRENRKARADLRGTEIDGADGPGF